MESGGKDKRTNAGQKRKYAKNQVIEGIIFSSSTSNPVKMAT